MAKRAPERDSAPHAQPSGPAAQAAGSDDLSIMFPDSTLTVGGRKVTVREYRFDESCDVLGLADPLIQALADLAEDEPLTWGRVRRRLYAHRRLVLPMAAQAGDVAADWLEALPQQDGERYMQAWWAVNGHFFVGEAAVVIVERRQAKTKSAGRTSLSSSPPADSVPLTASGSSQSVN